MDARGQEDQGEHSESPALAARPRVSSDHESPANGSVGPRALAQTVSKLSNRVRVSGSSVNRPNPGSDQAAPVHRDCGTPGPTRRPAAHPARPHPTPAPAIASRNSKCVSRCFGVSKSVVIRKRNASRSRP